MTNERAGGMVSAIGTLLEGESPMFEAVADEMPLFVWTALPDGRIDYVNRFGCETLAMRREEICARWVETIHPDDRSAAVDAHRRSITEARDFDLEMRYRLGDGSYRWFLVRARPMRDRSGAILRWFGTSIDVHEARMARQAAEASDERHRLYAEATREGLWFWDIPSGRVEWAPRLYEVAEVALGNFGGTLEAYVAQLHPDDRAGVHAALAAHLERREPYRVEFRMRTDRGTYKLFAAHGLCARDAAGAPTMMVGGIVDITEQRQNEAMLRERRALIDQQADAIRELSTPIMEVWDGVVTMPVLGTVDAARAQRMMEVMLDAVVTRQCRAAIVDLTGVSTMDAATAEHLGRLLSAVALLGAQGIVVGIKPEVARTLVSLGVDVSRVKLLANLREALLHCMAGAKRPGQRG